MSPRKSIFLKVLLVIGFLIFFYPNISDYVNSFTQTTSIVNYDKAIGAFDKVDIQTIKNAANAYNRRIFQEKDSIYYPNLVKGYDQTLNPFHDGVMGYITIDKIGVSLPIYHGVTEGILQTSVGHLPGTSLPVGGPSTHAVLSGHSGLRSAKLFTDLHKLGIGDEFVLSVLGEDLYYKVCHVEVVLPKQVDALKVFPGKDYVTLFTCTPYGVNTHRLLVRGERIDAPPGATNQKVKDHVKKDRWQSIAKLVLVVGLISMIVLSIIKDVCIIRREKLSRKQS